MVKDLFIDLYRYRERENRNPLEDWLTECLAAVLRSLPPKDLVPIIASLTEEPEAGVAALIGQKAISIKTQHYTEGGTGIPDLLVMLDDVPWILFENKVNSPIGSRQLDRYGSWLARQRHPGLPWQALVFLTYTTSPPEDFTREKWATLHGGCVLPCVASWARISRNLNEVQAGEPEDSLCRSLALSFHAMLESKNMSEDYPNNMAIAALELFTGYSNEVHNLVVSMWSNVKHAANSNGRKEFSIEPWPDMGVYGASRYVKRAPKNQNGLSYIGTGIWFPDLSSWEVDEELGANKNPPRGPQVFVCFGNEGGVDLSKEVQGKPGGEGWFWSKSRDCLYVHKPLAEFAAESDRRGKQILEWCGRKAGVLKEFLVREGLTEF